MVTFCLIFRDKDGNHALLTKTEAKQVFHSLQCYMYLLLLKNCQDTYMRDCVDGKRKGSEEKREIGRRQGWMESRKDGALKGG